MESGKMIYLDNAATSLPKPDCVIEAVVRAMQSLGNASRGAYGEALSASRILYQARVKLSKLLGNPHPERLAFTANSTMSLNMALLGSLKAGDHVITTDWEHNSVLRPLHLLGKRGVDTSFVPANKQGMLQMEAFAKLIRPETKAIVVSHGSNLTGNILDLSVPGNLAAEHNLLFIVDASQTAGSYPINMEEENIDILCFTGHKSLLGPQGTGGIIVREGVDLEPLMVGGSGVETFSTDHPVSYPTHLEAGTLNSHGIAGLEAAASYILEKTVEEIYATERQLWLSFVEKLREIPELIFYGDLKAEHHLPIVACNLGEMDSATVADILSSEYNIAIRAGGHCAPRLHRALGTEEQGALRFSLSQFTTEAEIDFAVSALKDIVKST